MFISIKEEKTLAKNKINSGKIVPVKFDSSTYDLIKNYANDNEMDSSKVIRLAVKTFLGKPTKKLTSNLKAS